MSWLYADLGMLCSYFFPHQVGESALMYACKMRDLDSVKSVLERKANPNAVTVV